MSLNTLKFCGNPKCKTSTGINDVTTHGWGYLTDNGFWEYPCFDCARYYESITNEKHWPFVDSIIPQINKEARACVVCSEEYFIYEAEEYFDGGLCDSCLVEVKYVTEK